MLRLDVTRVASGKCSSVEGASTHQETTVTDLQRSIREAGFEPRERDTLYRVVERDGSDWKTSE